MKNNTRNSFFRAVLFLAFTVGITVVGGMGKGSGPGTAGAATAVSGEILLKLRSGDAITPLLTRYDLTLKSRFGARPIFRLGVGPLRDVQATIEALLLEPDVLLAEENALNASPEARKNRVFAIGTRQDYTSDQWALDALRLTAAHAVSTGQGIRVAVLDTGVDTRHPDLRGRLMPGHDFVDGDLDASEVGSRKDLGFGHGTHVAGIVARAAPGATIMPLRVLDPQGQGNAWVLAEAILFSVDPDGNPATDDGVQVINLSLGTPDRTKILDTVARLASCSIPAVPNPLEPADDLSDPGYNGDKQRCLGSRGAAVLAAAGNDRSSLKEYPAAEGAYGLAAIGASNAAGRIATFSNFGSWVHLVAPGEDITSSVPRGGFGTWSGTSMATPWASATAALLLASDPLLTPKEAVRRLARTASPLCGSALGQLDPLAALLGREPAAGTCN
jgi:subtilisin family serine protease